MYKISVYGKGGVGKSTVSANLSYLLSIRGHKVLHIGCDPKHDSARLLTNGKSQKTFLDCMAEKDGDPLVIGSNGITCLECGGAEPGIGCAGKGMSAMFSYVEENTPQDTDIRVCDVLGDVVCGGFGVPMRRSNTDGIIIVVSEDFMSIYAANNILRGIRNLNGTACILGMVLNSRHPEDGRRVELFSEATGVPVIGKIDQSRAFSDAEARGKTVSELYPDSESSRQLAVIADAAEDAVDGRITPVEAHPLNDDAMTQIAASTYVTDRSPPKVRKQCGFDTVDEVRGLVYKHGQAMPACTSHGAVHFLEGIKGAAVVLHGPRNCSWLMAYAREREALSLRWQTGEDVPDTVYSTAMDSGTVFGGDRDAVRDAVERAYKDGFRTVFVVLTCTSETIGTDVEGECALIDLPGLRVIPVHPDVKSLTSKFGGRIPAMKALASVIDRSRPVEKDTVCLLGIGSRLRAYDADYRFMHDLLGAYGLRLKYIFPDFTDIESVEDLWSCEYFITANRGPWSRDISAIFAQGRKVLRSERLSGMQGTRDWCAMLSEATGRSGNGFLERAEEEYDKALSRYRGRLEGRKAILFTRDYMFPNSVIDTILDLGMDVCAIAVWPSNYEDLNEIDDKHPDIPRIKDVRLCNLKKVMEEYGADIVVSGDPRTGRAGVPWIGFFAEHVGYLESVSWAGKLCNAMVVKPIQSWRV